MLGKISEDAAEHTSDAIWTAERAGCVVLDRECLPLLNVHYRKAAGS